MINFTMKKSFRVNINAGQKTLLVEDQKPLLTILKDNDIFLPSACGGRGLCGMCKTVVKKGGGDYTNAEKKKLKPGDLEKGLRLACQLAVYKDIEIEIPKTLLPARRFWGRLATKNQLTSDIVELGIEIFKPKGLSFTAGQYIQLESPGYDDGPPVSRAYSIASPPSKPDNIELIIKRVPNGICTTWIFDRLKPGMDMSFNGPHGKFVLSDSNSPIIFIAGGSGMAPILSMIRHMNETSMRRNATYIFGALTQKDLFHTDFLSSIPGVKFIPTLSNEPVDSDWTGERGLVTETCQKCLSDASRLEAYLCGSPGMIEACVKVLTGRGIPKDRIFYDKY